MKVKRCAFLSLGEWDYIQSLLARHNSRFDWYLVKKIDSETGGKFGKNYTW